MVRAVTLLLTLIVVVSTLGCFESGAKDLPPLGSVTGKVTLDGAPLSGATVTFQSVEMGRMASGKTDPSGNYTLYLLNDTKGAILGENKVFITTFEPADDSVKGSGKPETLAARYHEKTELSANVAEGSNQFDFDLSTKK